MPTLAPLRLVSLAAGLCLLTPLHATAATEVILDDTFADGDRTSQTPALGTPPYTSIPWNTTVNNWVKTDGNGMVVTTQNGSTMVWGFFAPEGKPVELKVGESLRLTFEYAYATDVKEYVDFRVGLFNSGSATREKGAPFRSADLKGYFVITRTQSKKPDGSVLMAENHDGAADTETFNNKSDKVVAVGAGFPTIDAGADKQQATLTVTRTSDTAVDIAVKLGNSETETILTDANMKLASFDSVGFFLGRLGEGNTVTLSNLKVELIKP